MAELHDRLGGLPSPVEAHAIWDDIWHLEAHHSTALEGNTLALREVEELLDSGRALGAKTLAEYNEVAGYAQAARWVYGQAAGDRDWQDRRLVTITEVRHIHRLALTPAWDVSPPELATDAEQPGDFRRHDIHPFDGGMQPPPWNDVHPHMTEWVRVAGRLREAEHSRRAGAVPFPERLAELHTRFERIHPFLDGNGRVGRLALNLVLVRLGYPPVVVFKRQRPTYLQALQKCDRGDFGPLGELIARAMLDNLTRFIVPNVAGPARLVPLAALADEDFTLAALRQAAQRGRLEAVQGSDGAWRSSRSAVEAYARSKHRRRPR